MRVRAICLLVAALMPAVAGTDSLGAESSIPAFRSCDSALIAGKNYALQVKGIGCTAAEWLLRRYLATGREPSGWRCAASILLCWRGAKAYEAAPQAFFASSSTPRQKNRSSYCSPTGDLCMGVRRVDGALFLEIDTFARYFDRYRLCVRDPHGRQVCKGFPIHPSGRFFASRVRWHANFPPGVPGRYRVTWLRGSQPLGPVLSFVLPS